MKTSAQGSLTSSTWLFKALADPVRLRLLHLLAVGGEVCVCHLHEALGLSQPTVSRHLAYLRKHGLVAARKEGLWVHYRLSEPGSALHRALLRDLALLDDPVLENDRRGLERVVPCRVRC
jgi:ArsR family transcriptional regulator